MAYSCNGQQTISTKGKDAQNVLGIYLHGLLEDPAALQALFGARLDGPVPTLDTVFERMADFIETHFEPGVLDALRA